MRHSIKNYSSLATTPLRRDALTILEFGMRAIHTPTVLRSAVTIQNNTLTIGRKKYDLARFNHIYVIGIGKAAFDAACALEKILGSRITDGVVIDVKGGALKRITCRIGTHPLPTHRNMKATAEIIALLKNVEKDDLVITIISGGGSSLLCWPTNLTCQEMSSLTSALIKKGAPIQDINTVRKHTSDIQGGQLAALVYPAKVIGLIFSDVPGNDLSMVASGPTYLDTSTQKDAARILLKYDILRSCNLPTCQLKETPKDPTLFRNVDNILMVSSTLASDAMKRKAKTLGYRTRIFSNTLTGEAKDVGTLLTRSVKPGEALIATGETTVTITGKGRGGRNQELVLSALQTIPDHCLLISCATDGIDNSPAAGAIADSTSKIAASKKRLPIKTFLTRNDSFTFFSQINQHIITGMTGSNVSDVMLVLRKK